MSNQQNDQKPSLQEIAQQLGISVNELLQKYGDEKIIVEKYERGELQVLMD